MIATDIFPPFKMYFFCEFVCQSFHNNILETFHCLLEMQLISHKPQQEANPSKSRTVVHQLASHLFSFICRLGYTVGMSCWVG